MRVLMLNPSFSAGAFNHRLCNALVDLGLEVDLWTGPLHAVLSSAWEPPRYNTQVRFYRRTQLASWRPGMSRHLWRAFRMLGHIGSALRLLAQARRYDVVHVYFHAVQAFDSLWHPWLQHRAVVAYHVHNVYPHDAPRTAALTAGLKRIYHGSDLLFCHTEDSRQALRGDFGVPDDRITLIPLGNVCDIVRRDLIPDKGKIGLDGAGPPLVLMLGDVRHDKGVDVLLRATAILRERGVTVRVLVAGRHPGGSPRRLAELATELGVSDRVEFRSGFIAEAEIPAYLAAADIVAFPYREIAQSAGAVWAISYGRPIVASRIGGLTSLVEDGGAGLLVPPESPRELAAAIEALLRNPADRERMGAAGRRYAQSSLDWRPIAQRVLDAYERALAVTAAGERGR
ncbi:MAG TPA: glycosyltransferase family 4 protein [Gemmatimonadales bacterium]|nr:glycosyltransferase family 4 protein [Gemmatimonadales bacterium]